MTCQCCKDMDRRWQLDPSQRTDMALRRRRRVFFHFKFCMTPAQQLEWLKAGGMNQLRGDA